jgi:hypothetical protein
LAPHFFFSFSTFLEYSKLSMGPLWAEILDHITPVLNEEEDAGERVRPPAKLAVYSGYDSTIMQLLSTLNVWNGTKEEVPPYASMVLIEIHELVDDVAYNKTLFPSKFIFRLIYNGKVLTSQVEGCADDSELCDAQQLMTRVTPFAIRAVDCVNDKADDVVEPMKVAKSLLSKTGGVLLALFVAFLGALLGGLTVFFYLTGTVPNNPISLDKLKKKSVQFKNTLMKGGKKKDEESSTPRGSMMTDNIEMILSDADAFEDDNIMYEG